MSTRVGTEEFTATVEKLVDGDEDSLESFIGPEVEMTTEFGDEESDDLYDGEKLEKRKWDVLLKIICVGGCTGGADTKGLLIRDYMRTRPVQRHSCPLIGVNFSCHWIQWQADPTHDKGHSIMLQLWEIPEQERFRSMARLNYRNSCGALVFWGPSRPCSLKEALACKEDIIQETSGFATNIPLILVTDNTRRQQWIGPGKMFESTEKVDEFCQENDFVTWFELTSRDWDSGEDSVLGQAVHEVVAEIFKRRIESQK